MHTLTVLLTAFLVVLSAVGAMAAEGVAISIDKIVQDDHIAGTVTGLTEKGRAEHKVVVYVKTDRWYIHPYERGDDGKSWASTGTKGSWKIETVRRDFAASAVAALVVKRDSKVPAQVGNVRGIPHEAITIRELEGTPDHKKL